MKKILFILAFVLAGLTTACAQNTSKSDRRVYDVVEVMPEYPGGMPEMMNFMKNNVRYPADAQKKKIEGRVVVSFVIDSKGDVTRPVVARKVHPSLDAEALRVVRLMPKWKPGMQDGKAVAVKFSLPVEFRLK